MTAARIMKGQMNGETGEETSLAMDKFTHLALSKVRKTLLHCSFTFTHLKETFIQSDLVLFSIKTSIS